MVKSERVGIQVEPELQARIDRMRKAEGISISAVIRNLLSDYLEKRGF